MRKCIICGKEFNPDPQQSVMCSTKCRQARRNALARARRSGDPEIYNALLEMTAAETRAYKKDNPPAETISKLAADARKFNLSYGRYVQLKSLAKLKCKDCKYAVKDKHSSFPGWTAYRCDNPPSLFYNGLLNITKSGEPQKEIVWFGCAHGERRAKSDRESASAAPNDNTAVGTA